MIWTGGEIVPDDALTIGVHDRAFEHGLGLFETLRLWDGRPTLLPRHLDRLTRSARALGLPIDGVALPTADDVAALLAADGREGDAMLRITLTGGASASGGATLWMRSAPLPPMRYEGGARLGTTGPARLDPLVAHKTLNYWPYRLLGEKARAEGCDEAILIDPKGCVMEGTRTNVFFVVRGALVTPPADGRILPGVMRSLVIERARGLGIAVEESPLGLLDRRLQPGEIFLTNAVRGVVPVGRWGGAEFPAPGATTGRIWDDVRRWLEGGGA
ncbi:aminotransferase class IV [Paludisphaera sp.]|uniref:aminotransferase class IV n=1 Tax=Paludisphaera sp. TaxID=2017432 RepID=UPI00301C8635